MGDILTLKIGIDLDPNDDDDSSDVEKTIPISVIIKWVSSILSGIGVVLWGVFVGV